MMIKMPRHKRDIDVPALADRLAVVHRLKDRKTPRVLLHLPCECIQEARAFVSAQRLPSGLRLPRGGDCCVHVLNISLRHFGKRVAV